MDVPHPCETPATLRVVDLETTGQNFANGGVVEIGWQDLRQDVLGVWQLTEAGAMLVDPRRPISPETSAIHHIVDADVRGAPLWHDAARSVLLAHKPQRFAALAAHRAAFEQRWCTPAFTGGTPWICTYKCALRVWPEAPTHSNQGLRYWRQPEGLVRDTGLPAHRAGPDAYVTAHHLRDMLAVAGLAQLLTWSAEPALLPRVPFGVHRGRRWEELDEDALERILRGEAGGNLDMVFSARMERRRRQGGVLEKPAQSALML